MMNPLKDCLNRAKDHHHKMLVQPNNKLILPDVINDNKTKSIQDGVLRFGGLYSEDLIEDVDKYMRHLEEKLSITTNFLESKQVNGRMRQTLVNWLFHVQERFELLTETMSLAVYLLDRSLSSMEISKKNLQLLGVSCVFVASKFEEIMVPNIADLVYISANAFSKKDLLEMEQKVMQMCHFQLGRPHAIQFLRRLRFFLAPNSQIYQLARYILEVSMLCHEFAHQKPSTIAAAALFLAIYAHHCPISARQCQKAMGVDLDVVRKAARELINPTIQFLDPLEKLNALREKYKDLALTSEQINRLRQFEDNFE